MSTTNWNPGKTNSVCVPSKFKFIQICKIKNFIVNIDEHLNLFYFAISLCHLEGDPDEPHAQNQKILYNTGELHNNWPSHILCMF